MGCGHEYSTHVTMHEVKAPFSPEVRLLSERSSSMLGGDAGITELVMLELPRAILWRDMGRSATKELWRATWYTW